MVSDASRIGDWTYRKSQVTAIHDHKDDVSNFVMMVTVAPKHQTTSNYMMREHLPVILPSFFYVNYHYLLYPESELDQVIPFEKACHLTIGPICPNHRYVHPIIRVIHDVLIYSACPTVEIQGGEDAYCANG